MKSVHKKRNLLTRTCYVERKTRSHRIRIAIENTLHLQTQFHKYILIEIPRHKTVSAVVHLKLAEKNVKNTRETHTQHIRREIHENIQPLKMTTMMINDDSIMFVWTTPKHLLCSFFFRLLFFSFLSLSHSLVAFFVILCTRTHMHSHSTHKSDKPIVCFSFIQSFFFVVYSVQFCFVSFHFSFSIFKFLRSHTRESERKKSGFALSHYCIIQSFFIFILLNSIARL